jgi:hypothetical protein
VAELGEEIQRRGAELERYRRIRHDLSLAFGTRTRAFLVLVLATVWSILPALMGLGKVTGLAEFTTGELALGDVFFIGGLVLPGVIWARESLLGNVTNRRLVASVFMVLVGSLLFRTASWLAGVGPDQVFAHGMIIYFVVAAMTAIAIDRRLASAAVVFFVGAVVAMFFVEQVYWIQAVTNFGGLLLVAYTWRPSTLAATDEEKAERRAWRAARRD